MSLSLRVTQYKNRPAAEGVQAHFDADGGTLGRAPTSTLALHDPEKYISRVHGKITRRGAEYYLEVVGRLAVTVNGRTYEQGAQIELHDYDQLEIGDYALEARLHPDTAEIHTTAIVPPSISEPVAAPGDSARRENLVQPPAASTLAFGIDLGGGLLSSAASSSGSTAAAQSDQVPVVNQPIPPVQVTALQSPSAAVSEQSDALTVATAAVTGADGSAADAPPGLRARGDLLDTGQPPPSSEAPVYNHAESIHALLLAAGVPEIEPRVLRDPDFMKAVGEMLRELAEGLHKVLKARAATKREFGVDSTMMEASGNSPFKFSATGSEALRHLLAPRGESGFLPPIQAIRDALSDVQAHQLATIAGTRAALEAVFQRFDPQQIESKLKRQGMLDKVLPINRKARLWDLVNDLHASLVKEAQDDFDRLFGVAFASAYREQVGKLRAIGKPARTDEE